jgi:adenylate cyclase
VIDRRQLRRRLVVALAVANVAGGTAAGNVVSLLQQPGPLSDARVRLVADVLSLLFTLVVVAAGATVLTRIVDRRLSWLDEDRRPTSAEITAVLRQPWTVARITLAFWAAVVVAVAVAWLVVEPSARNVARGAVAYVLAALIATGLSFLLTERLFRPVVAEALHGGPPPAQTALGVRRRMVLAWALGSAIPLAAIFATPIVRSSDAPVSLEVTVAVFAAIGLTTGYLLIRMTAGSVADPLDDVRRGFSRVADGDLEVSLAVDDSGEVGMMQAGFNEMVAGLRERQQLQDLFGRHVGEEVARRALEGGVALGGEERDVTVFFVDLVGSTTLAREQPATEVVELLNRFFRAVVATTTAEGGWVNKFEGDGALCVFGAPADQPDHAARALRAAAALDDDLRRLGIDAGIGVSTGRAVAGNVGAEDRYEYTVIGQPVNEAARLTDEAKRRPGRVLASAATLKAAGGLDGWAADGMVKLRGIGEVAVAEPAGR